MPRARVSPLACWGCRATAAALLVSAASCDLGGDRLSCTLDPAALVVAPAPVTPQGCVASLSGKAFADRAECGVACPRPWSVTVRWSNRTTGGRGAQPVSWIPGGSCWPFFNSSCGLSGFALEVPITAGANDLLIEADEGDGFTACQHIEAAGPDGCHQ